MLKIVLLLMALVLSISACNQKSCYNDNQICCTNYWFSFDAPSVCYIHDPLINKQVPIDPNIGEITTCAKEPTACTVYLFEHTQCYVCQAQYTDSMGNTWKGKAFNEPANKISH